MPKTYTCELEITIAAAPRHVWELWVDVPGWTNWYTDLASVALDGPFADGSSLYMHLLTQTRNDDYLGHLQEVKQCVSFIDKVEWDNGVRVRILHLIEPQGEMTSRIHLRVDVTGSNAEAVGQRIAAPFGKTLINLKKLAEIENNGSH